MKTILLRGLAGLAILAVGVFVMNGLIGMKSTPPVNPRPANARLVKVMTAVPDTLNAVVQLEGRVQAKNRMTVIAEVNGMLPVGGKEFREGVSFQKGEVMLSIDDRELRANLVSQRSQWLQLLASSLADLQLDFPDHAAVWSGYVSSLNVENVLEPLPEAETDRERLYLTSRGIVSGYHAIRASESRLAKHRFTAPFDGVVTATNVEPGSMVRAGQPLGSFVGTGTFEVKSAVHARHLDVLRPGQAVVLREEGGREVARGEVSRTAGHVDAMTQSASVFCRVEAVQGETLRDGRFLAGEVIGDSRLGVVALDEALLTGGEGQEVFVVTDNRLALAAVVVVHRDADRVLVNGLDAGAVLLAEPVSGSFEGMLVETTQR
ncbi:MAG: efflux RND transporter periplasmic adaptor subunit [Flavobacteriales bacterium]